MSATSRILGSPGLGLFDLFQLLSSDIHSATASFMNQCKYCHLQFTLKAILVLFVLKSTSS